MPMAESSRVPGSTQVTDGSEQGSTLYSVHSECSFGGSGSEQQRQPQEVYAEENMKVVQPATPAASEQSSALAYSPRFFHWKAHSAFICLTS